MLSLKIKATKNFMSQLLIKDTFDGLFLSEAVIKTAGSYTINGQLNRDFFTDEEWAQLAEKKYSRWQSIKPFCFELIKGSKTPSYMKIIFMLPPKTAAAVYQSGDIPDISGETVQTPDFFLNIIYRGGTVNVITGVSMKTFSLDKTPEKLFDAYTKNFLFSHGMDFEEA